MTARNFIVAKRDHGFAAFARSGFYTAEEAARLAALDGLESMSLADFYRQADPDKLPEWRARRMAGLPRRPAARVVVVTGAFDEPRDVVEARLRLAGFKVRPAISAATTHVVAGRKPSAAKIASGLPILTLAEAIQ